MPKNRSSDSYVEAAAASSQGSDADPRMLLLDGITDYAVFMLDATGHVASWNPGGVRIHGYTAEELVEEAAQRLQCHTWQELRSPTQAS
jgi:PAS domain-containing protein